ncbi:MAG: hypothetical protein MZV63_01915 [Marinilabiliales bacterium]|nr:hypothetical protein [Marinilabiliales bacterium]
MQKSTVIILIALLLAIAPALSGQRPGPEYKPGLIKWIDDNRMLIRLYDDEKKPVIMDEANLVTKEYDCRTGKSVKVEKYRTDMQKMRALLPEGITPGPDMAVSSDMTAVVLVRDSDIWYYSSGNPDGMKLTDDKGTGGEYAVCSRRQEDCLYEERRISMYYDLDQQEGNTTDFRCHR